jgi:hypothetical protein
MVDLMVFMQEGADLAEGPPPPAVKRELGSGRRQAVDVYVHYWLGIL